MESPNSDAIAAGTPQEAMFWAGRRRTMKDATSGMISTGALRVDRARSVAGFGTD